MGFLKSRCAILNRSYHRIPGDAGRNLIRTYFEAEHDHTVTILPRDQSPSPGPSAPVKPKESTLRAARGPRPPSRPGPISSLAPYNGALQSPTGPFWRGAAQNNPQALGNLVVEGYGHTTGRPYPEITVTERDAGGHFRETRIEMPGRGYFSFRFE